MQSKLPDRWRSRLVIMDTGCHEWPGATKEGYGVIGVGPRGSNRHFKTHRLTMLGFENYTQRCVVCHRCHNRRCNNPDHLYVGTYKDNFTDEVEAGKVPVEFTANQGKPGELNRNATITNSIARAIYILFWEYRYSRSDLRAMFGTSKDITNKVIRRDSWCEATHDLQHLSEV